MNKKLGGITFLVLVLCFSVVSAGFWSDLFGITGNAVSVDEGLVAYYSLDGNGEDSYGGNALSGSGSFADGIKDEGLYLDGSYNLYNSNPDFDFTGNETASFSIASWFKVEDCEASHYGGIALASGSRLRLGLIYNQNDENSYWYVQTLPSTPVARFYGCEADTWVHIVGTYNSSTQMLSLYKDGNLKQEKVTSGVDSSNVASKITLGHAQRYFRGTMDDVAIYDRALSASEVQEIYDGVARDEIIDDETVNDTLADEEIIEESLNETLGEGNTTLKVDDEIINDTLGTNETSEDEETIEEPLNETIEEEESESCSGCIYNEQCYPFGIRLEVDGVPSYCDIDNEMKEQRTVDSQGEWASCQNSYECESNLCSAGECIGLADILDEANSFKKFIVRIVCKIAHPIDDEEFNACVYEGLDDGIGGDDDVEEEEEEEEEEEIIDFSFVPSNGCGEGYVFIDEVCDGDSDEQESVCNKSERYANACFNKSSPEEPEFVAGEILVSLKNIDLSKITDSSFGVNSLDELASEFGVIKIEKALISPQFDMMRKITLSDNANIPLTVEAFQLSEYVDWVEPNYIYTSSVIPSDTDYSSQWALPMISAEVAWGIETGDPSVIIAIIDTGIDTNHTDLIDNLWTNPGETPANSIDDDNNNCTDDIKGCDFALMSGNISDLNGHGTHCAGIAAAKSNNSLGISGLCWNCMLMAGKSALTVSEIGKAIDYSVNNGARVISMSFGGSTPSSLIDNVTSAYNSDIVVIAAAGNANNYIKEYPAAFDNVIGVAATEQTDARAPFSKYGDWMLDSGAWIDVAAPGQDILSTIPPNDYISWSGTSMAAPLVAGLAGLIISKNPSFTAEEVRQIIRSKVDRPVNSDKYIGIGRINAYEALQVDSIVIAQFDHSIIDGEFYESGDVIEVMGSAKSSASGSFSSYELFYADATSPLSPYPLSWDTIVSSTTSVDNGELGSWDTTGLPFGNYVLRLVVTDSNGEESEDRMLVSLGGGCGINLVTDLFLSSNIIGNGSEYIILDDDNVTLDCQGHTIANCPILAENKENIDIRNCNIILASTGVVFVDVEDSVIHNNSFESNNYGLTLSSCSYNDIWNNTLSNNLAMGINIIDGGIYNKIYSNIFPYNHREVIRIREASYNSIYDNHIYGTFLWSFLNGAITIENSSHNILKNNLIDENRIEGVYISNSNDNELIDNRIIDNIGKGIYLELNSDKNELINNIVNGNGRDGIKVSSGSFNIISNNKVSSNEENGINLYLSPDNTLRNNVVNYNGQHGIILKSDSNYNELTSNTANSNALYGIYLTLGSNNNELTSNTANSNLASGISLFSSKNNLLDQNTAKNNNKKGILLESSSNNNELVSNIANENDYGIYLDSSSLNTMDENTANKNTEIGIYLVSNSDDNSLESNTANDNTFIGVYFTSDSNDIELNKNVVCFNGEKDIKDMDTNSGDENTCDITFNWDDSGTENCTYECELCGNNVIDEPEECDGSELGDYICDDEYSGYLYCNEDCTINYDGCPGGIYEIDSEISNCDELQNIKYDLTKSYELMNDIDCSETYSWDSRSGFDPIGDTSTTYPGFTGVLDGKGYEISNMIISRPDESYVGIFASLGEGAIVKNLGLKNIGISGKYAVGALAGYSLGTIKDTYSKSGSIASSDSSSYVGGLVGEKSEGIIENTYTTGGVYSPNIVGGIVGQCGSGGGECIIKNSFSTSSVRGKGYNGGLIGWIYTGTIENSDWSNIDTHDDAYYCYGGYYETLTTDCISPDGETPSYHFQGDSHNYYEPLASWDFESIWQEVEGGYPELRVGDGEVAKEFVPLPVFFKKLGCKILHPINDEEFDSCVEK